MFLLDKFKLIPNWKQCWRFAVMWVQGAGASAMTGWLVLGEDHRQAIIAFFGIPPSNVVAVVALLTFLAGGLARVTRQDSLTQGDGNATE